LQQAIAASGSRRRTWHSAMMRLAIAISFQSFSAARSSADRPAVAWANALS
jgi:hypothetical protein